jgi:hypothetical protein
MNSYLKNLINEQEKNRILGLHKSRIQSEFKRFINEEIIDPKVEEFFNSAKEQMDGFPEGSITNYGNNIPAWKLNKRDDEDDVFLFMDGSAIKVDAITGAIAKSTNKWFTTPIKPKIEKAPQLQPKQIDLKTNVDLNNMPQRIETIKPKKQDLRTALDTEKRAKKEIRNYQNIITKNATVPEKLTSKNNKSLQQQLTTLEGVLQLLKQNEVNGGEQQLMAWLPVTQKAVDNLKSSLNIKTELGSGPTNPTQQFTQQKSGKSTFYPDDNEFQ